MRGQPLRLLGLLLVQRGAPVSAESAIEALWAEGLPANPSNALQLVVSRLRRTVGAGTVVTDAGGYALALRGPEAIDADRFDRLAAEGEAALERGEPAAAARLLQSALELWRGPALYGVRYESYAAAEIARLDERRLACLGGRIDAQLALGRSERVVDELAALVVEHPLRESFRRQLVRALRDSGRGAEALAAYRGAPDDLGLPDLPAEPPRPARRQVVCVAVDVRPSLDGAPLDLEARDDVMAFCAAEAETILQRHGDPVIERVPEGLIAVFGARETHEDEGLRAVRAATALQRRLAEVARDVGVQLELRVGLTAGTALVTRPDGLPSGEVVAASTQVARTARAGELAVSAPVRALLRSSRTQQADTSPLAGRDRDLDRLHGSLAEVRQTRSASLTLLLGEPGIGKSRLVREVAARSGTQARVLVGRCPAYGDGVTYWPLREIVLQAQRGRPLAALLEPSDEGRAAAAVIAATLGLGGHAPAEAAPWAFRMLLEALARDRPLLLALDDAHWAEPPLLDLVDELVRVAAPVLVLCVGRPELLSARPAWATAARIQLAPVDAAASRLLLAGQSALGEATVGRIVARARGNPLFLEQLAAHVAESGEEGGLPPALHALIAARLDALSATHRRLIEAAAVEGDVFHLGGLDALVPDIGRRESERSLEELVLRELLLPAESLIEGERAFGFRHALVREAAYATVPLMTRAEAHQRLAAWLAGLGAAVPEASARVAAQLERAHAAGSALRVPAERLDELARRAAERLSEAAREVHRRGDLPSEIAFLDRALALLEPHDGARAELLPALGAALFEAGSLDRAAEVADGAILAGRDSGRERVRWRGEVERARLDAYRHPESVDPGASLVVAERAATALEELADVLGVARARYLVCELLWLQGRSERALQNAREVVRLARLAEDAVELDAGVSYVAWALVVNRAPVSFARTECQVLLREVGGRRYAELGVRGFAAVLDAMEGRFDAARAQLARSRAGLADLGLQQASIWMATFAAYAELLAGDPAAAAATLDEAECIANDIGDRWFLSTILVDRAHVLLADERLADEAAAGVARIEERPSPNDAEWVIKRHAARGKLAAREGDAERALSEARAAVELADATEMFLYRADAARDLAEVARRVGAREDAARARAVALELYRAKGNLAAAAQLARSPSR